jgi:ribosomal protein S18 acetylase RimI-like enzyme
VVQIRPARRRELPDLGEVLARAFSDDPVWSWIMPPELPSRDRRLARFFTVPLHHAHRIDAVWTTYDAAGAAVWLPPGEWKIRGMAGLRMAVPSVLALRRQMRVAVPIMATVERHHPTEPHWYLEVLGTDPDRQGRGVGSAVLGPVLARCDEDGVGAYLESSKEANIAFYNRHGFEVTEQLDLPDGCPPVWLMWREPQPLM